MLRFSDSCQTVTLVLKLVPHKYDKTVPTYDSSMQQAQGGLGAVTVIVSSQWMYGQVIDWWDNGPVVAPASLFTLWFGKLPSSLSEYVFNARSTGEIREWEQHKGHSDPGTTELVPNQWVMTVT